MRGCISTHWILGPLTRPISGRHGLTLPDGVFGFCAGMFKASRNRFCLLTCSLPRIKKPPDVSAIYLTCRDIFWLRGNASTEDILSSGSLFDQPLGKAGRPCTTLQNLRSPVITGSLLLDYQHQIHEFIDQLAKFAAKFSTSIFGYRRTTLFRFNSLSRSEKRKIHTLSHCVEMLFLIRVKKGKPCCPIARYVREFLDHVVRLRPFSWAFIGSSSAWLSSRIQTPSGLPASSRR